MSAKKATASTNSPPPHSSDSEDSDATITPSRQLKRSRESPCETPPATITPETLAQRKIAQPRARTNPKSTETAAWAQEYREQEAAREAAREAVRAAEAAKAAPPTQAPPPTPPTSSRPPTSPAAQLAALRRNLDAIQDILTAVSPTCHGAQWAELQTTVNRAVHLSSFDFFPTSSADSSSAAPPAASTSTTSASGCASPPARTRKMSDSPIKKRTKKWHKSPSKRAAIIGKKRSRGSDDEVEARGLGEKRVRGGYMQEGDDPIEYESDSEEEEYTPKVWTAEELRDEDDEDDDEDPWVQLERVRIIVEEETAKTPVKRKVEVVVEEEEKEKNDEGAKEEQEEEEEEVEELEEVAVVEKTNKKLFTGAKVADIEGETLEEMGLRKEAARKVWEEKTRREAMKGTPAKNQQQAVAGKKRKTEGDGQGSAAKKMAENDLRRKEKRNLEENVDDRFGKKPKNI